MIILLRIIRIRSFIIVLDSEKGFEMLQTNQKDFTILVNSCDDYQDAWEPFFRLLKIQWPECEKYDIMLSTHSLIYNCDFLNIKTITSGNKPWSTRLWNSLQHINTEFVLFFLEDQFLQKPVNVEWLNKSVEFMKSYPDTGVIILRHTPKQNKEYDEDFFPREEVSIDFRIVGMVAIYRKDYLLKILRQHENVWEFEKYASIRSKRYKERVLQYNNRNPEIFVYNDEEESGLGIKHGKWLPKNKELFEKYGIEVNYDNLGVLESYRKMDINEENDNHSVIIRVKNRIKKTPQNLKKSISKFRSLK